MFLTSHKSGYLLEQIKNKEDFNDPSRKSKTVQKGQNGNKKGVFKEDGSLDALSFLVMVETCNVLASSYVRVPYGTNQTQEGLHISC